MSKIIYTKPDGTVAVVISASGNISDAIKDVPDSTSYSVVDDSAVPSDRSFRNAWVGNNIGVSTATISEDITKAKEIHKTNIRTARTPKLQELDIEFQKAQETSAGITTIVAKKQALRDAPAASGIATAANTTELKAQWDTSILGDSPYS